MGIRIAFKYAVLLCKIVCYSESKSICLCLHPSTQYIAREPIVSGAGLDIWDAVMVKHRTSPRPPKASSLKLVGERNVCQINRKMNILFQIMAKYYEKIGTQLYEGIYYGKRCLN